MNALFDQVIESESGPLEGGNALAVGSCSTRNTSNPLHAEGTGFPPGLPWCWIGYREGFIEQLFRPALGAHESGLFHVEHSGPCRSRESRRSTRWARVFHVEHPRRGLIGPWPDS